MRIENLTTVTQVGRPIAGSGGIIVNSFSPQKKLPTSINESDKRCKNSNSYRGNMIEQCRASPCSVSKHKFDTTRLRDKYGGSDLLYRVGRQWITGGARYHGCALYCGQVGRGCEPDRLLTPESTS